MNWDEKAAARFDPGDYATPLATYLGGVNDLRNHMLSSDSIERAALGIHASHDRGDWDEELPVVQDEYLDMARAALAAALGEDESNE